MRAVETLCRLKRTRTFTVALLKNTIHRCQIGDWQRGRVGSINKATCCAGPSALSTREPRTRELARRTPPVGSGPSCFRTHLRKYAAQKYVPFGKKARRERERERETRTTPDCGESECLDTLKGVFSLSLSLSAARSRCWRSRTAARSSSCATRDAARERKEKEKEKKCPLSGDEKESRHLFKIK